MNEQAIKAEMAALAARAAAHQQALRMSNQAFCAAYREYVGSADSWRRLKGGEWEAVGGARTLEKWRARLLALCARIDAGGEEAVHDSLPVVRHVLDVATRVLTARDDRRLGFLVGPTGVGKSKALTAAYRAHREQAVLVAAQPEWRGKLNVIVSGLADAAGSPQGRSTSETFKALIATLQARPALLLCDEWHYCGVAGLPVLKTVIDRCPGTGVVMATYTTMWNNLRNGKGDAFVESHQLLARAQRPVDLSWEKGCRPEDVLAYLKAEGVDGADAACARRVLEKSRGYGLRIVADAVRDARSAEADGDADCCADAVERAVAALAGF